MSDAGVTAGFGHKLMLPGPVLWRFVCGAFSDGPPEALSKPCGGIHDGSCERSYAKRGLAQQLRTLRTAVHPATRLPLPPPIVVDPSLEVPHEILEQCVASTGGTVRRHPRESLNPVMKAMLERMLKRAADAEAAPVVVERAVRRRISVKTSPVDSAGGACSLHALILRRRLIVKTSPSDGGAAWNALLLPL